MCSVSLESYLPYLPPQKVSKIPKIECIHSGLPKNAKSHFGCLGRLGVNQRQLRSSRQQALLEQGSCNLDIAGKRPASMQAKQRRRVVLGGGQRQAATPCELKLKQYHPGRGDGNSISKAAG
jgi:hypothetical protein